MPTTAKGLRYPASSAAPNIPQDIQNLANDVNGALPGAWVDAQTSSGSYAFSPTNANAWENLPGTSLTTVSIPIGRTLDVQFRAPACNAGDGFVYVRLLINSVEFDQQAYSACWAPVNLNGSFVPGTVTTATILVQMQRTGTAGDVRAVGSGVVRTRYRII